MGERSQITPDAGPVEVSIVIPALNEAANLPELLGRIDAAMAGRLYEVLIIDDKSADGTPVVCAELARKYPLTLHVRKEPHGGLGGAVLLGLSEARGDILVVMDADLQHPPEHLPELIAPLQSDNVGFVLGSRYMPGGSIAETWGVFRRINSRAATLLAFPFSGRTRDPMSGFFALRRQTFETAEQLTPLGYKIGLELMCKCRVGAVREIPIHFDRRRKGKSKLTLREQFRYLEHLSRLYDFHYPRLSPIIKFLIATGLSWAWAFVGCIALLPTVGLAKAAVLAYPIAILVTAVFHVRYVRTQREFLVSPRPWLSFWIISAAEWLSCAVASIWCSQRIHDPAPIELFLISFGCATGVRYILRKEFLMDIRGLRRDERQGSRRSEAPTGSN